MRPADPVLIGWPARASCNARALPYRLIAKALREIRWAGEDRLQARRREDAGDMAEASAVSITGMTNVSSLAMATSLSIAMRQRNARS